MTVAEAFQRLMLLAWQLTKNCFFTNCYYLITISLFINCIVAAIGEIGASKIAELLLQIDTGSEKISLKVSICLLPMASRLISLILAFS